MATVVIQKRIYKTKVSYLLYYYDPVSGKKKYYKALPRKKEAQQAANDLRALIDSGNLTEIIKKRKKLSIQKFSEVSAHLVDTWRKRLDLKKLKQKTLDEYEIRVNLVNREFGNRLLCDISRDEIVTYHEKVAREFTNVTANRSLFIIKQVFKHGLTNQAIKEDPTTDVRYLSEKEHQRNRFLLPEELERLVAATQDTRSKFYMPAAIFLGAEHGASKQEVLSLEWSDIKFDFDGQGTIRFFRTKNGKERTEYLMPRTREALLTWRNHLDAKRRRGNIQTPLTDRVICRINGKPLDSFDKAWRAACKIARVKNFHFHDLRHTFCSSLILSGSDLKDAKEMIGHSDISMTDRYSHLTLLHKRSRQDHLAKYYGNCSEEHHEVEEDSEIKGLGA